MAVGFPDKETDQRESCRYPAWTSNIQGELWFGGRRTPVRLYDQSAGGFAVMAVERPTFTHGDILQLHLDSEVFETRVTHIGEEAAADLEGVGTRYRIGLERITEFFAPDAVEAPRRSWLAALLGRAQSGHRSTSLAAGFVLATVVVVTPVVFSVVFQYFAGEPGPESADRSQRAAGQPGRRNDPPSSERKSDWGSFARLPGASALLVPSVVQDLRLTDAQQQQIRGVVEKTEDAFKRLESRLQRMSREGQARSRENLLGAARKEALAALTAEQRSQFEARTNSQP